MAQSHWVEVTLLPSNHMSTALAEILAAMPRKRFTPEEYLLLERAAETKSEYVEGEIVAMSGASRNHNEIVLGVGSELRRQLRGKNCSAFVSDMRVMAGGSYFYPDAGVVCEVSQILDAENDTILNPALVAEVLSPTTARYDRQIKLARYQSLSMMQHILLIAQDRVRVEHYRRHQEQWILETHASLSAAIELTDIGCSLPLAEIYEGTGLT